MRRLFFTMDIENANNIILDYGVIGVVLLALAYFAWHQYKRDQVHSDDLKKENKDMYEKYIALSTRQTSLSEKQTELLEKLSVKSDILHRDLSEKIEEIPTKTLREMTFKQLEDEKNHPRNTPTGS